MTITRAEIERRMRDDDLVGLTLWRPWDEIGEQPSTAVA